MLNLKLRPSQAIQWMRCPGSARMQELYKPPKGFFNNDAAEEGTAAHWVAAEALALLEVVHVVDELAPNGVLVTNEMLSYADEYVSIVRGWNCEPCIEQTIKIDDINNEGTPDCYAIDYINRKIFIIDYKFGFNIVEPQGNWQLISYLSGILDGLDNCGFDRHDGWNINLIIYQPRASHPEGALRSWKFDMSVASDYLDRLNDGAFNALRPEPFLIPGAHCKNCDARHKCGALQKSTLNALEISKKMDIVDLNLEQAEQELSLIEDAEEILKSRRTGLQAQVEYEIAGGARSTIYELVPIKKREVWQTGKEHFIIALGKILGKDLAQPQKALTPTQCRKLGVDNDAIKEYSIIPAGENKLAKRNLNEAKKLFGN